MRRSNPSRRAGFTLIELLTVIAIIMILSMATFGLFRAASSARNKSKSKGEIQAIAMACENYKKNYGDYPCRANSGTDNTYHRDLFDQLIGRRLLKSFPLANGTDVELIAYDDPRLPTGSGGRKMKSFIDFGAIGTNDNSHFADNDWRGGAAATYEFRDAWGNAYDYRYRVLNTPGLPTMNTTTGAYISPYADWKSPNFLVVSCGANYIDLGDGIMPAQNEYWDVTTLTGGVNMMKNGIIPANYFEDDPAPTTGFLRADNIVNWTN
jgi:prepilin-type N-terminal cleavage/methylation domain-containing protein